MTLNSNTIKQNKFLKKEIGSGFQNLNRSFCLLKVIRNPKALVPSLGIFPHLHYRP